MSRKDRGFGGNASPTARSKWSSARRIEVSAARRPSAKPSSIGALGIVVNHLEARRSGNRPRDGPGETHELLVLRLRRSSRSRSPLVMIWEMLGVLLAMRAVLSAQAPSTRAARHTARGRATVTHARDGASRRHNPTLRLRALRYKRRLLVALLQLPAFDLPPQVIAHVVRGDASFGGEVLDLERCRVRVEH